MGLGCTRLLFLLSMCSVLIWSFLFMPWIYWKSPSRLHVWFCVCVFCFWRCGNASNTKKEQNVNEWTSEKKTANIFENEVTYFCGCYRMNNGWHSIRITVKRRWITWNYFNYILMEAIVRLKYIRLWSNETECLPWISESAQRIWIMKTRNKNSTSSK